jgi:4-diphosphocytidyl-2-C-methyl-D-erythritol kinase
LISFPSCKINLGLHVIDKRPDGFHNIESILIPVEWQDILEIIVDEKGDSEPEFKCSGIRLFGPKEKNLCFRAYKLLAENHELPPVKMLLHKIIPVGAGLGGGSSDAANTLLLLDKLFRLGLKEEELEKYASQLGSDCPFFIRNKTVLVSGKGDVLESVKLRPKSMFCVIVKPRVHVSTANAYALVKPRKRSKPLRELIQAPIQEWQGLIENDFEKAVFELHPAVKNIKARLYKLGAVYASMSGSGSAVFGFFNDEKHLDTYFRSSTVWSGKIQLST